MSQQNGVSKIFKETYRDFAQNTSIHGLKYTVKDEMAFWEKLLWAFVILFGICGSIFMFDLFWRRFSSNPTRTTIQSLYEPTAAFPFPAITVCNINLMLSTKVDSFIEKMNLSQGERNETIEAFPQLLIFMDPLMGTFNLTKLKFLEGILKKRGYTEIVDVLKEVTENCDEMLQKCKWMGETVDCDKYFVENFTPSGICCSFNYITDFGRNGHFAGFEMGLTVLINPLIQTVRYSSLYSRGVKVLVHNNRDYPGSASLSKILSVGRHTFLSIAATKLICGGEAKMLTRNQRECLFGDETSLDFFGEYAADNCIVECNIREVLNFCGCVHYYYSFTGHKICGISTLPCLLKLNLSSQKTICDCPAQCEDVIYSVTSTSTKIQDQQFATSGFLSDENLSGKIVMHVYFGRQIQTVLRRDMLTSTTYLLSSIGGIFSLFLGCSFISVLEIIYYFTMRFLINWKILSKQEKQPKKINLKKY